jgi:transposase
MFKKYITRNGQRYAYLVESYRTEGKIKQKTIEYLGKVVCKNGKERIIPPKKRLRGDVKVRYARRFGDVAVLHSITQELHLQTLLNRQIVKNGIDPGELSTIIAINRVVEPKSGNSLAAWYADTALTRLVGLEKSKISSENIGRMFDAMYTITEAGGIEDRVFQFEMELWAKLQTLFDFSNSSIVYDITSTYVYGSTIPVTARGYNRDGNTLLQYNVGLAVTEPAGIPIHFKVFPGSIVDVSTVKGFAHDLRTFGVTEVTFVVDRGFFSTSNLVDLVSETSHVIGAIPATLKKYSQLLSKSKNLEHPKNACTRRDELVYLLEHQDIIKDIPVKFIVVLNPVRREREHTKKMKHILEIEEQLHRIQNQWKNGTFEGNINETVNTLTKDYKKCFTVLIRKYNMQITRHDKAIQRILNRCGKYIIFTTHTDMEPRDVIDKYFEKDVIEKSFFVMKHLENLQPTRVRLENRVYANVFMCYLGYLLYSMLKSKIPQKSNLTTGSTLEELSRIREIEFTDQTNLDRQLTELTKNQKNIIKSIGMKSLFGLK